MRSRFGLAGILAGALILSGCQRESVPDFEKANKGYRIDKYNIESVTREADGVRVYWHDKDDELVEKKYWEGGADGFSKNSNKVALPILEGSDRNEFKGLNNALKHIKIFSDLNEDRSYIQVINYKSIPLNHSSEVDAYYVEIHLPKNTKPPVFGSPVWEGKFPVINNEGEKK